MRTWLSSITFPTMLIIILTIFTAWFNKITLLEEQFSPIKNQRPATTMYNANIKSFTIDGELKNDVHASQITQRENSNYFILQDSNITRYKNGRIIQSMTAKQASFDDDTKHIKLTGGYEKDPVEIIINEP